MAFVRSGAVAGLVCVTGCGGHGRSTARPQAPTASPAPPKSRPAALVKIKGFEFRPTIIRITRGTRVTWTDVDAANHNVLFAKDPGDLGNIREGDERSATFGRAGRFSYVCQYHPNMRGTVVVV